MEQEQLKRKKQISVLVVAPTRELAIQIKDFFDDYGANLSHVKHFVLDEADQMLDMGMIHDVKKSLLIFSIKGKQCFF